MVICVRKPNGVHKNCQRQEKRAKIIKDFPFNTNNQQENNNKKVIHNTDKNYTVSRNDSKDLYGEQMLTLLENIVKNLNKWANIPHSQLY